MTFDVTFVVPVTIKLPVTFVVDPLRCALEATFAVPLIVTLLKNVVLGVI